MSTLFVAFEEFILSRKDVKPGSRCAKHATEPWLWRYSTAASATALALDWEPST